MQTTLLGLAIALILALVTALVGPLLIDWGTYRSLFEAEASHLIGVPVRVTGAIDARLLPSPRLNLHDVEVGQGSDKIRAQSLAIEFALGPLMRGEWRADEMHLAAPSINLGIDAAGHIRAPNIAVAFDPDALSIDRLGIEDGTVTLTDAVSGSSVTLSGFWFNGEARSLVGPFKGEGAVTIGGELYPYRLSAGRYGDDGVMRLRLNVDPVSRPLAIEADGALTLKEQGPRFEGTVNLTRPVGLTARAGAQITQPWRVSGKVQATPQSALIQNLDFLYGSEEQGLKLTGDAEFSFGAHPRFNGVLSGRQIDLDRMLASGEGARVPPAAALRQLIAGGGGAFRPPFPITVGIGVDQVTLGGGTVQNFRGDISSDAGGWNLDRLEFRAPGFTQVRLSGRLAVGDGTVAFTGPTELDAREPKALAAWLEGRGEAAQGDLRPLSLRGDITLGSERIAIERLRAEFERKSVTGRLVYDFKLGQQPTRLDAELNAPELDVDAALAFGQALIAGSKIERPQQMTIAADIGQASIGGFTAHNASARLKIDGDGLRIDRLAVADLGGTAFSASGRITTGPPAPQGSIGVDLTAPDPKPVLALLARFAPETVKLIEPRAATMAPAKLHAQLTVDGAASATQGRVVIDGSLGQVRVALNGQGKVDTGALTATDIRATGKFAADDGRLLTAMLGLDRVVAVANAPGSLTFEASGAPRGMLHVNGHLAAGGLDASIDGSASPFADKPAAMLRARIAQADAAPLRAGAGAQALPVSYASDVALKGDELAFNDIDATVAGAHLRGKLALTLGAERRLTGDLDADTIDGAGLVATAIGMPAGNIGADRAWSWSSEPFGKGAFGLVSGQVALKAQRADLLPQQVARDFRATLRFNEREIAADDIHGLLAGGRLGGRLAFHRAEDGLQANAKFSLAGADVASLLGSGPRPAITGKLDVSAEMEGSGLSPVALIGALKGKGEIALSDAQLAGLNPRAFDAVTHAVDEGLAVDPERISGVVRRALESGQLAVKNARGALMIGAGQVRLHDFDAKAGDSDMNVTGNLDLTDGLVDARLVLSGATDAAGNRPDIYMALKGPVAAPVRSIDLTALSGWLTLRAVDNQAKRLRAIEQAAPPAPPPAVVPAAPVPPPAAPASRQGAAAEPNSPAPIFPPVQPPLWVPSIPSLPGARAPALPPPLDIGPPPHPAGAVRPEASVDPHP
ncbi:MAG TPA: AsmA-like C-terminal region-containing protein [Pseudolabrys sp.]|nr:AsmA-like C-terminal region-containing protein [Pseudolabrys sp.]